jgi:hypothetical protein
MVLSLPLHNRMHNQPRLGMELPTPSSFTRAARRPRPTPDMHEYDDLSYYASPSSNSQFLSSALWGIFWEPHVGCSPVSAWLQPVIRLAPTLVKSGNLEVVDHIFAHRCPSIVPLRCVVGCGRTKVSRSIVHSLKIPMLPVPSRPMPGVVSDGICSVVYGSQRL